MGNFILHDIESDSMQIKKCLRVRAFTELCVNLINSQSEMKY